MIDEAGTLLTHYLLGNVVPTYVRAEWLGQICKLPDDMESWCQYHLVRFGAAEVHKTRKT